MGSSADAERPYHLESAGEGETGDRGTGPVVIAVTKTLIDVDDDDLAAAQRVLSTQTKKDTVNAALREAVALAARRRDLQRLTSGSLADLAGEEVMRAAWQR